MKRLPVVILLTLVLLPAFADDFTDYKPLQGISWDDFVQSLSWDEETMDESEWRGWLEDLEQLHMHPMDINKATPEEMALIPFLTPVQIEDIQAYVHLDGPMKSLGELALIRSIDSETRKALPLFMFAGTDYTSATGTRNWQRSGKIRHTADTRMDVPFYYRKGYVTDKYAGNPLYHRLRYNMEWHNVLAGVHIEKDPGERFYDSYGGYAMVRDLGILRQAIAGDYRIGWGEGLVVGNGSYGGKSSMLMGNSRGLRPMSGTSETGFLRGAAVSLGNMQGSGNPIGAKTGWEATVFASVKAVDATLNKDEEAQTLITSGMHRTETECTKKDNTLSVVAGAHAIAKIRHFIVGIGGYWQHYDRALAPGSQTYRRWYPAGRDFGVAGIHGSYSIYRLNVSAEMAYSSTHNGIAACGKASYIVSRRLKLGVHGRYYSHKYHSFLASSLSEGSGVQNESGALVRVEAEPMQGWALTSYLDFFADYWPRYQMHQSSSGLEFMIQNSVQLGTDNTLSLRYQLKRKEYRDLMQPHHRLRLQWTMLPRKDWKLQTTASLHIAQTDSTGNAPGIGVSVSSMLQASWLKEKALKTQMMLGYFNTSNYDSRVYMYEPAMYNSIAGATYYGHGIRMAALLRYTLPHGHWTLEAKYTLTAMFDRDQISSGDQTIYSGTKSDLSLQVRITY